MRDRPQIIDGGKDCAARYRLQQLRSSCFGGQMVEPYEQKTQQSPGFG